MYLRPYLETRVINQFVRESINGDSPGGEKAELPQGRQPAWPGWALKVPAGHGRHSPAALAWLLFLNVPNGQGLGL